MTERDVKIDAVPASFWGIALLSLRDIAPLSLPSTRPLSLRGTLVPKQSKGRGESET